MRIFITLFSLGLALSVSTLQAQEKAANPKKLAKKVAKTEKKAVKARQKAEMWQKKSDASLTDLKQAVADKKAGKLTDEGDYEEILSKANKESLKSIAITEKAEAKESKAKAAKEALEKAKASKSDK